MFPTALRHRLNSFTSAGVHLLLVSLHLKPFLFFSTISTPLHYSLLACFRCEAVRSFHQRKPSRRLKTDDSTPCCSSSARLLSLAASLCHGSAACRHTN